MYLSKNRLPRLLLLLSHFINEPNKQESKQKPSKTKSTSVQTTEIKWMWNNQLKMKHLQHNIYRYYHDNLSYNREGVYSMG